MRQPKQTRKPRQPRLRLTLSRPEPTREEPIQRQAIQLLAAAGYRVLQTSVRYRFQSCPECGHKFRPTGGTGTTPGVPDLLVGHDRWPAGAMWIGLEMKGTKTALSLEQRELLGVGRILVARSDREALEGVQGAERTLFGRVYGGRVEEFGAGIRISFREKGEGR